MKLFIREENINAAGSTREKIDSIHFLTNFSSGKMGYEIPEVAANLGAEVLLISGPTALTLLLYNYNLQKIC